MSSTRSVFRIVGLFISQLYLYLTTPFLNERTVSNISATFSLLVGLAVLWVNALMAERQSRQQLAVANEQLRQYADQIADRAILSERDYSGLKN
jgi:hypothetical protein